MGGEGVREGGRRRRGRKEKGGFPDLDSLMHHIILLWSLKLPAYYLSNILKGGISSQIKSPWQKTRSKQVNANDKRKTVV